MYVKFVYNNLRLQIKATLLKRLFLKQSLLLQLLNSTDSMRSLQLLLFFLSKYVAN